MARCEPDGAAMSFYIQISEEEMSEEIVFGDERYEAAVADGSLTDETRKSERARETEREREAAAHLGQL